MISLTVILAIIIIHYIADFIFQAEKWATGKSKNIGDLLAHTSMYTLIFYALGFVTPYWINGGTFEGTVWDKNLQLMWFFPITFVCHTITDYFTSKIVSKKFAAGKYGSPIPNLGAFSYIGFDQVLHYVQLFLTFYLLQ